MATSIKDYIKKLKDFESYPDDNSFDSIYNKINKPKRKKRGLIWFLFGIIGLFVLIVLYQKDLFYKERNLQNRHPIALKNNVKFEQTDPSKNLKGIDLTQGNTKLKVTNKDLSVKSKGNALGGNENVKSKSDKSIFINISSDLALTSTKTEFEKNTTRPIFSYEKEHNELIDANIISKQKIKSNNSNTKSRIDSQSNSLPFSRNVSSLIKELPNLSHTIRYSNFIIPIIPKLSSNTLKVKKKRYIRLGIQTSNAQYCRNALATRKALNLSFVSALNRNIDFTIGLSHHSLSYDIIFDENLISFYSGTNKYPGMYFLEDELISLNNSLHFQTFNFGVHLNLLAINKFNIKGSITQDLIINTKQNLRYTLIDSNFYNYTKTSKKFTLDQSRIGLVLEYYISEDFHLYGQASYGKNFKFIGIEKEKYSGLVGGVGLGFKI